MLVFPDEKLVFHQLPIEYTQTIINYEKRKLSDINRFKSLLNYRLTVTVFNSKIRVTNTAIRIGADEHE